MIFIICRHALWTKTRLCNKNQLIRIPPASLPHDIQAPNGSKRSTSITYPHCKMYRLPFRIYVAAKHIRNLVSNKNRLIRATESPFPHCKTIPNDLHILQTCSMDQNKTLQQESTDSNTSSHIQAPNGQQALYFNRISSLQNVSFPLQNLRSRQTHQEPRFQQEPTDPSDGIAFSPLQNHTK